MNVLTLVRELLHQNGLFALEKRPIEVVICADGYNCYGVLVRIEGNRVVLSPDVKDVRNLPRTQHFKPAA